MPGPARTIGLVVLTACAALATSHPARAASDPTPKGWLTYVNTKYDFDICYPPSLHAAAPAAAGDGQTFTAADGGTLTVFWRPGTSSDSLTTTAQGLAGGMGAAPRVSYTADRPGWAVRSGRAGDSVFYIKVIGRDADYLIMQAKYPAASAASWNGQVGHFAACFESSRP